MDWRKISISFVLFVSAIIVFILLQEKDMPLRMVDRATGLFAYMFIFLAILSSEYMMQMMKIFGKGFINVHHLLARIGMSLMFIHPIAFAFEEKSISVFLPVFYPLKDFLELAGRPAFYLIIIAVLAGVYRKHIIKKWKNFHYLNYLAFIMIFIHAWLIGTDLEYLIMKILWIAMALIVVGVFVHKHMIRS
ncbi:MAG: ferric reductase [Halobacteriota archaeon]